MQDNEILDLTKDVKWIGVLDPDLRVFDIIMETKFGTTYNSYFINAQKKTIVEVTKAKFWGTYLEKIKQVVNPEEIEYIILDHSEPDHSGNLDKLLKLAPKAKVVGSGSLIRFLIDQLGHEFPHVVVKDGQTLDLGDKTMRFVGAANLHWPDTIFSYLVEDKILFSCDCFGSHFCDEAVFDDLTKDFDEAFKYYFDTILSPYSKFMLRAIERIRPLDISIIATGHGPVLRTNWKKYVDLSEEYARKYLTPNDHTRVFIPYVSAYKMTAQLAEKIAEGVRSAGDIEVHVVDIENVSFATISEHLAKCSGMLVGSPTINKNTLLQIYQLFALVNPIHERGKLAAVFGSYGWSGECFKIIRDTLANLRFKMFDEDFTIKFALHKKDYERCLDYGKRIGKQLLENKIEEE